MSKRKTLQNQLRTNIFARFAEHPPYYGDPCVTNQIKHADMFAAYVKQRDPTCRTIRDAWKYRRDYISSQIGSYNHRIAFRTMELIYANDDIATITYPSEFEERDGE